MIFENVESLNMNNKEVTLINVGNGKIFEKISTSTNEIRLRANIGEGQYVWLGGFDSDGEIIIDWGDGTEDTEDGHDYVDEGIYDIVIYGDITSITENGFSEFGLICFDASDCLSLTSLGDYALYGNPLETIILPSTVNSIGEYAFGVCTALKNITLPSGLTSLPACLFTNCTSLESVNIPSTVTSIGRDTFYSTRSMTNIILPSNLTIISSGCFADGGLININIPRSVSSMGDRIWEGCPDLNNITFNWVNNDEIISYNNTWLNMVYHTVTFTVPNGTISLYEAKGYPSNKLQEA